MIPFIHYDKCEGCGGCAETFPGLFMMRDGKAWLINHESFKPSMAESVKACCPFYAITVE